MSNTILLLCSIVLAMTVIPLAQTALGSLEDTGREEGDRPLPDEAADTGNKDEDNECGGSDEVKEAFPTFGTKTGELTGLFVNKESENHKELNLDWADNAADCSEGD